MRRRRAAGPLHDLTHQEAEGFLAALVSGENVLPGFGVGLERLLDPLLERLGPARELGEDPGLERRLPTPHLRGRIRDRPLGAPQPPSYAPSSSTGTSSMGLLGAPSWTAPLAPVQYR